MERNLFYLINLTELMIFQNTNKTQINMKKLKTFLLEKMITYKTSQSKKMI